MTRHYFLAILVIACGLLFLTVAAEAAVVVIEIKISADDKLDLKIAQAGNDVVLEHRNLKATVTGVDQARLDKDACRVLSTKRGHVVVIAYGSRNDCAVFIALDAKAEEVTSVADWRPRDGRMIITGTSAKDGEAESVANIKLTTGWNSDVFTQFDVVFGETETWRVSPPRYFSGKYADTKKIPATGDWVNITDSESSPRAGGKTPKTYHVCVREPTGTRPADLVKVKNPGG